MKTVTKEWSQKLVDAGWVKETYFSWYYTTEGEWVVMPTQITAPFGLILHFPAQTIDELGEELSYEDLMRYCPKVNSLSGNWQDKAPLWLYTTLLDPDRMAEVWVWKMKGGK